MLKETLVLTAIQSGILFLALWGIFRLAPSIPANAKAWIWRLAFLKPLLSLLPFAMVTLPILPPQQPVRIVTADYGYAIEPVPVSAQAETPPEKPAPVNMDPLLMLWAAGAMAVAGYAVVGMRKAWKITNAGRPIHDEGLVSAFEDLLNKARIQHKPRLLSSPRASTPMLVGGRGYAIVLPEFALTQCEFEDLRLMMAHEIAHIERQDLWWFSMVSAVQSLFFFNPMVWVAVRCSRLDHESATDKHASRLAGVPIQTYADMLLRATTTARPALAPGALPMAESYRTIHRRLEAMKHFNSKPTFWRRTSTAALAIITMGMLPAYNLVAAAVPTLDPVQDPVAFRNVRVDDPIAVVQSQDKELKKLADQKAKLQKELQKKQLELDKVQKEMDKKAGKQKTAKAQNARNHQYWIVTTQGEKAKEYQVFTTPTLPKVETIKTANGETIKVQRVKDTYRATTVDPTKPNKDTNITNPLTTVKTVTSQGKSVTWKIADRSEQGNGTVRWRTQEVPSAGEDTVFQISGKNLTVTVKDGVYYLTAEGPVSIKPVKVTKGEINTPKISYQSRVSVANPITVNNVQPTTVQTTSDVKTTYQTRITPTKPVTVQGTNPVGSLNNRVIYTTAVQGKNVQVAPLQGTVTYTKPLTVIGTQPAGPLRINSTVNTKPVTILGTDGKTLKGNFQVTTTSNGTYRVITQSKVSQSKPKSKEKTPPSVDPLIFPPN